MRNFGVAQDIIDIFSCYHGLNKFRGVCPSVRVIAIEFTPANYVAFIAIDKHSAPAKIKRQISAIAIYAIGRTNINKSAAGRSWYEQKCWLAGQAF